MDLTDEKLTTYSLECKYTPSIHAAVSLAKHTLNKYYQLMDSSHTYRIAMSECAFSLHLFFTDVLLYLTVLHPHHKLTYFLKAKWELEWINATQELVEDKFQCNYVSIDVVEEVTNGGNDTAIQLVCSESTVFKC